MYYQIIILGIIVSMLMNTLRPLILSLFIVFLLEKYKKEPQIKNVIMQSTEKDSPVVIGDNSELITSRVKQKKKNVQEIYDIFTQQVGKRTVKKNLFNYVY